MPRRFRRSSFRMLKKDTMGQCVSKKAAKALGQHRANMRKHQMFYESPEIEQKITPSRHGATVANSTSRGISSSTFGFKKRNNAISAGGALISANSNAAKRLANTNQTADNDPNGNNDAVTDDHRAPLISNAVPSGRTTSRIPPPKKEPNATRQVSRFGFRQPPGSRYKVADINESIKPTYMDNDRGPCDNRPIAVIGDFDSNRNRGGSGDNGKFMLQATQLPKPVPVRIMDTKTAKTLANNNRKISGMNPSSDESSKDGSSYLTEDSGIGSLKYEKLNASPKFGSSYRPKRTLNMVVTGNKFEVQDGDLPELLPLRPSTSGCTTGVTRFVHKRAMEYERTLDRDHRKISVTSSEVSTSDYAEQEFVPCKTMFLKPIISPKWLLKPKLTLDDSSPPTSDDQMWTNGGEAMAIAGAADDFKCSFSSSDESKDHVDSFNRKEKERSRSRKSSATVAAALDNLLTASKTHMLHKYDIKQVLLTIEDPNCAAIAAESARQYNSLLSEEPSPDDSFYNNFINPDKDDILLNRTLTATSPIALIENTPVTEDKSLSSIDKLSLDINDKQQPQPNSSPETPTNGSNSMSLSEGRDFLIDDEIADQPALLIDDTITNNTSETATTSMASEITLVDATPKSRRKVTSDGWMESPLLIRRKQSNRLRSRAGSLDTLSPCESIASDDFMMDYSMSSGIDDTNDMRSERNTGTFLNDDGLLRSLDISKNDLLGDWSSLLSTGSAKSLTTTPNRPIVASAIAPTRLLRSRATTPNSNHTQPTTRCPLEALAHVPRLTPRLQQQLQHASLPASSTSSSAHNSHTSLHLLRGTGTTRSSSSSMAGGYDSDESASSLRLERSVQSGMIQDAMALKTMLFRLKRVLQENMDEDILLRSETHNPFDSTSLSLTTLQQHLYNTVPVASSATKTVTNGHVFGSACLTNGNSSYHASPSPLSSDMLHQQQLSYIVEEQRLELADMRRQVLYQQGQLEDRDKEVQRLKEDMARLMRVYDNGVGGNSVPAVTNGGALAAVEKSNAATQTERIRPISCGPALLDATSTGNSSLVSSTEVTSTTPSNKPQLPPVTPRTYHHTNNHYSDATPISRTSSRPPLRHGGSRLTAPSPRHVTPSPVDYTTPLVPVVASSIPRRSCSRSRT